MATSTTASSAQGILGGNLTKNVATARLRLQSTGKSLGESVQQLKKTIGNRLFSRIACLDEPPSKRELAEIIASVKNRKKLSISKASGYILEFLDRRNRYRQAKKLLGGTSHMWYAGATRGKKTSFWDVAIGVRFAAYKHDKREKLIAENYRQTQSHWVGGERSIEISYSDEPFAEGWSVTVWHKRKTRSGTNSFLNVAFSPTWLADVHAKGIAVIAGMVTTHATETAPGVFRASWVEQGRGFEIRDVSGYIVLAADDAVHGATELAAKQTLRRRNPDYNDEQSRRATERAGRIEAKVGPIRALLESGNAGPFGDILVSLSDSIRAGNCETGTQHWSNKYFPGRENVSIQEILAINDEKPLAIAACLRAIRRSRALSRMRAGQVNNSGSL